MLTLPPPLPEADPTRNKLPGGARALRDVDFDEKFAAFVREKRS